MHCVLKSMKVNEMADENMLITDSNELEQLYGAVAKPSLTKVTDHIHPAYRPFIEASTFVALATSGPDGLDVSPRGDPANGLDHASIWRKRARRPIRPPSGR